MLQKYPLQKSSVQEKQENGEEEKCLFQGTKSDEQAYTTDTKEKKQSTG